MCLADESASPPGATRIEPSAARDGEAVTVAVGCGRRRRDARCQDPSCRPPPIDSRRFAVRSLLHPAWRVGPAALLQAWSCGFHFRWAGAQCLRSKPECSPFPRSLLAAWISRNPTPIDSRSASQGGLGTREKGANGEIEIIDKLVRPKRRDWRRLGSTGLGSAGAGGKLGQSPSKPEEQCQRQSPVPPTEHQSRRRASLVPVNVALAAIEAADRALSVHRFAVGCTTQDGRCHGPMVVRSWERRSSAGEGDAVCVIVRCPDGSWERRSSVGSGR